VSNFVCHQCTAGSSHSRLPRQPAVYRVQPQNGLPALLPRLATRRTIALEQFGQVAASGTANGCCKRRDRFFDASGSSLNLAYTDDSEFNYTAATVPAVPEPAAWPLMLVGTGLLLRQGVRKGRV